MKSLIEYIDEKLKVNKNYKSATELNEAIVDIIDDPKFKNCIGNETPKRAGRTIINDIVLMYDSCISEIIGEDASKYDGDLEHFVYSHDFKPKDAEISGRYVAWSSTCPPPNTINTMSDLYAKLWYEKQNNCNEIEYCFGEKWAFGKRNILLELNFYLLENYIVMTVAETDMDKDRNFAIGIYERDMILQ